MKKLELDQNGITHWVVPLLAIAIITVAGVRVLTGSHAATVSSSTDAINSFTSVANSQSLPSLVNSTNLASTNNASLNDPISTWRNDLANKYPNVFGGVSANSDGSFNVSVTKADPALEKYALSDLESITSSNGLSGTTTPVIKFPVVSHSYKQLNTLASKIQASGASNVDSVSINEQSNQVQVSTSSSNTQTLNSNLKSTNGITDSSELNVVQQPTFTPTGTSRIADSAPWSGGDLITDTDAFTNKQFLCTTGPGVHAGSDQFSVTAGHCGSSVGPYYNAADEYGYPAVPIGATTPWSDFDSGTTAKPGLDAQLIYTGPYGGSSYQSWNGGALGAATSKISFTGYAQPPIGAYVCDDGFHGAFCGTVTSAPKGIVIAQADSGPSYNQGSQVIYGFYMNGQAEPGDSGSPVWWPTIYGDLVVGICEASGNGLTVVVPITTILYLYSVEYHKTFQLNTVSNP